MAFAAWMAAMWYLPRLYVYHAQAPGSGEPGDTFKVMESRLLRGIGTPAMIATLVFGIALATVEGQWNQPWLHAKLVLVLGLGACHGLLAAHRKGFLVGKPPRSP